MAGDKRFVYVIRNASAIPRIYVGLTSDVRARLEDHNTGRCPQTSRHGPWRLHVVVTFTDEAMAVAFERFLKSGSGRDFVTRYFE